VALQVAITLTVVVVVVELRLAIQTVVQQAEMGLLLL
jgi:hypothetical protein